MKKVLEVIMYLKHEGVFLNSVMDNKKSFKKILSGIFETLTLLGLVGILILVSTTDIVEKIHTGVLASILEKNLLKYTLSSNEETNYVYYDYDISTSEKENVEFALMKLNYFQDKFKENNLKIFISRNSIDTSAKLLFSNLARFEESAGDKFSGSYYPNFNLIILDLYDLDTIYNMGNNEVLNFKYALELSNELNISTLLHEVGHFLDDISENELHTSSLFVEAYNTEKNTIFNKDEKYYKSSIGEYIAELISRILMVNLELMESEDVFVNSNTYTILNKYLKQMQ